MDIFSIFFNIKVDYVFSLESPNRGDSNSPVKLWRNLIQIATKGFFAVMIFLDLHF